MKRSDLKGTKSVFSFTFVQYFKSKSTIIMLVVMFIVSLLSVFSVGISMKPLAAERNNIENITIVNETSLSIDIRDIKSVLPDSANTEIVFAQSEDSGEISPETVMLTFTQSGTDSYDIAVSLSRDSGLNDSDVAAVRGAAEYALRLACYRAKGVTEEQLAAMSADIDMNLYSFEDYDKMTSAPPRNSVIGTPAYTEMSLFYSIAVMMLIMFSASFIIRSVIEEKESKLVELLMVSVKPLALITGKILATMLFVVISLLIMIFGISASSLVMSRFMNIPSVLSQLPISVGEYGKTAKILIAIPVFFISLMLGYLTFSFIGVTLGACCSKTEDTGAAMSAVSVTTILCYCLSIACAASASEGLTVFCSVFPFISVFTAPVSFISGIIGFPVLLVSWILQAAVIVLLAVFCAKVYGTLIIHRGNRIKLRQLFSIVKQGGKA